GLHEMQRRYDCITNVRGVGLFAAFNLPNRSLRDEFRSAALKDGVLALNSGFESIRLRPPVNLTIEEVDEVLGIFEGVTKKIESTLIT
ncbi:MAG: aminotransferase class III-fold pyridoxal phosphate-dependent enzyme, partial [Candidatus Thalassarchaeaceae archaeon]|nr:aminotransferase class III-fold pyridoxal phosphate-dependent enzyme [Candidatus Thalassarchaeaceae archaeon]